MKKGGSVFDIGMGGYAGAEKCDLVGLYLLSLIQHLFEDVGLFRDDGLAVSSQTNMQNEKVKQEICRIFKKEGFDITITANLKIVEFLDVELNLNTRHTNRSQSQTTKYNMLLQIVTTHLAF